MGIFRIKAPLACRRGKSPLTCCPKKNRAYPKKTCVSFADKQQAHAFNKLIDRQLSRNQGLAQKLDEGNLSKRKQRNADFKSTGAMKNTTCIELRSGDIIQLLGWQPGLCTFRLAGK
ncbi:hypothetical protein RZS08_27775, partial [Arthrospira platensis SPKY1]|nr:hypothetical protein [Arthrospira platensis SPKY1]